MKRDERLPAILLEIIVSNAAEARVAQEFGADRVELIAEREIGGTTPDERTIEEVVAAIDLPVHVIVRPHDNGFVYTDREREQIIHEAQRVSQLGARAIVFGALRETGDIDVDLLNDVHAVSKIQMTFHRAFDESHDPLRTYDAIAALPYVSRVLTSGAATTAWEGREMIRALRERRGPIVLAGVGVTVENIAPLLRETGAREVHVGSGARVDDALDPATVARLRAAVDEV